MLQLDQFDYHLPKENIAHQPVEPRDKSRLLVVRTECLQQPRSTRTPQACFSHQHFYDLPKILAAIPGGCVLVRNNTKVFPARLVGRKESGGLVEVLLVQRVGAKGQVLAGEEWEVLTKPGLKVGQKIVFGEAVGRVTGQVVGQATKPTQAKVLRAQCTAVTGYTRLLEFNAAGEDFFEQVYQLGQTPIPPYIHWEAGDEAKLRQVYQTTYAKLVGSVAAPTAGLHFTKKLDQELQAAGVEIEEVTLHVGLGTFLPVKVADVTKHQMHRERFSLSTSTAARLNKAKQAGKKIMAVGTTTARVLEACSTQANVLSAQSGETDIFIYPPYRFRFLDGLITNFHLPKSTLLMMVSALVSAPNTQEKFVDFAHSLLGKAYQEAIKKGYRFYSFGDAMIIFI